MVYVPCTYVQGQKSGSRIAQSKREGKKVDRAAGRRGKKEEEIAQRVGGKKKKFRASARNGHAQFNAVHQE